MNLEAAAAYAERHKLQALVIGQEGRPGFERYADGWDGSKPHALYSGTKSFWGVLAVAAAEDGLLDLEEPVSQTIPAWADRSASAAIFRI